MIRSNCLLALAVVCYCVAPACAEQPKPDPSLLTIDRIYASGELGEKSFGGRWRQQDGEVFLTTLEPSEEPAGGRDIVAHDPATGDKRVLVSASELVPAGESLPLKIENYQWSSSGNRLLIYTNSKRVWRGNTRGDYWLLDRGSRQLTKLGGDIPASTMMFCKFSPDGHSVAYVHNRDIYLQDTLDLKIRRLTHASKHQINGTTDWVYEEEFGLRDAFFWSPDSQSIAYWQLDVSNVQEFPLVNNTDTLYPTVMWFGYPKVGQRNADVRVGLMNVASGKTSWVSFPDNPQDFYIPRMQFLGDDGGLLIQRMNRLQNTNRLFLHKDRKTSLVLVEKDDAWVDAHNEVFWLDKDNAFTWISDRDGWRHVYKAKLHQGQDSRTLVTPGQYDVERLLHVDEESGHTYFIASPDNPTQRYLYSASGDGIRRITPDVLAGANSYQISPDGKWAIHRFSTANRPSVTSLISLPDHKRVRVLESNEKLMKTLGKIARTPVEFLRVDIGDGVLLDGWCVKPPNFDAGAEKKYPLLIYVYGEPAGSTVQDRWGGSSYFWHAMMAQKGFVVMSFDNRGTKAPRGREWRKSIYKKIGILPPQDQAAAVKTVLAERPYLDDSRVAIWGWSGGGSSSLQAVFKYPDIYHTAVAIAPVPNQRYYDTIYQERYMSLPELNVEGFREGSAINFAKHLEGNLLLVHGTADDNCHYATTEMLVDELIKHNKQFTMFAYPNRTHSIRERKNTTRHLRTMMTNFLCDKLLEN